MAKTPLQFTHNGHEVAIFVDGAANLLSALRDLVGDLSPKFGCGQGGCGACTVLIDGEPFLSCVTLAESVAGKSIETADGLKTSTPRRAAPRSSKRSPGTSAVAPDTNRSSTPSLPPPRAAGLGAPEGLKPCWNCARIFSPTNATTT